MLLRLAAALALLVAGAAQGWAQTNNIAATTPSTSTTTGALTVVGGLGVGGAAWVGGSIYSQGSIVLPITGTMTPGDCVGFASPSATSLVDIGNCTLAPGGVSQLGSVVAGHIALWGANGLIYDGGPPSGGANAPATVNTIATGTSNTLSALLTIETVQDWTSTTAGAKTQTIPACTLGLKGYTVLVKDEAGTAATATLSAAPASGTIDGAATKAITQDYGAIRATCDGGTNWLVL